MELISNPAGLRVLDSLIQLITNKAEIEKIIASINAARDEANAKIAVVGTIEDVEKLQDKAQKAVVEAVTTLAEAKAEANKLLGKAGSKAAKQREELRRAREILKGQEERDAQLDARERNVSARENELQALLDQASTQHREATEMKELADAKMAEAESKLKAFREVVARMQ